MKPEIYEVIVIGMGVTGFAAAMYAGRLGLKTLVIGEFEGGTINYAHDVENYPGFDSISGANLAAKIEKHAKEYDIKVLKARVEKVEKRGNCFFVTTDSKVLQTSTIIFATGSEWRKLEVPGSKEFEGRGVTYCALCDGPLFKGKTVAVVGGSDSAAKEALLLTEYAKKVFIIYRKEKIHPEPATLKQVEEKVKKGKIEIINNTNVIEIKGRKVLENLKLDKAYKNKKELKIDGLFVAIGQIPQSTLAKNLGVRLNDKSEIMINKKSETSVEGIFAAGDVTDMPFKQAIIGVSGGVVAAHTAYEYARKTRVCE